jgi:8-oxo-dGTP diphosphatase
MNKLVFLEPPENFSPKVEVAACFITVKGNVLFMKRQPHRSEGEKWGIPGGKLERGENALQAVVREIQEETGLKLSSLKHHSTVYIRYPEVDFIYHMFGDEMEEYPAVVFDAEEHSEYQWMTLDEALKLPLIRGEDECIFLYKGNS